MNEASNHKMIRILYKNGIVLPEKKIENYGVFYNQVRSLNSKRDKKIIDELLEVGVDIEFLKKHGNVEAIRVNGLYSGRNHPFVLTLGDEILTCSKTYDNKKLNHDLCLTEFNRRGCQYKKDDKTCQIVKQNLDRSRYGSKLNVDVYSKIYRYNSIIKTLDKKSNSVKVKYALKINDDKYIFDNFKDLQKKVIQELKSELIRERQLDIRDFIVSQSLYGTEDESILEDKLQMFIEEISKVKTLSEIEEHVKIKKIKNGATIKIGSLKIKFSRM